MACTSPNLSCTAGKITLTEIIDAVNALSCEQGGILWKAAVEYKIGDQVWDNTSTPAAIYACIADHGATSGDNVNGSPKQPSAVNWTPNIVEDPLTF